MPKQKATSTAKLIEGITIGKSEKKKAKDGIFEMEGMNSEHKLRNEVLEN